MRASSKERVLALLDQVPNAPEAPPHVGASVDELDAFEVATGLRLPAELRDWLRACNGSLVGPGGLFGVLPASASRSIQGYLALYPSWIDLGWIPIAGDGCGDYYVLDTRSGNDPNHPVYFLEHERTLEEPAYLVAVGVWRFLELLLQKELDHVRKERSGWPFNKEYVLTMNPELAEYQGPVPLAWETN